MATDPLNPTLDTTRKPSVASVDRRYRQPAVIPDNIPDDVEVVESETPQPVPQPVRRPRSFAPPDPSAEPEIGTTGGYIPKQAGTWDGKPITTADLSGDRATRMEQIRQETERRARLQFEKERPFAPSGEFKGPTTRAIRDASVEGEQAYGDLQQQRRQQIADRREQMRFDQKTRNATKEEQFRSTGQQFYTDPFGEIKPVIEAGTNRPLFSTTPKTLTKHPKTGEPVMEMRDKYGQRQYSRPKLVASDDPMDDRLYYDIGDGESVPAMTIEEAANHPDVSVAVRGKAARKRKMTAERNAATAAMKMDADKIGMEYDTAKMQVAAMKQRLENLTLQGGNEEEIAKLTDQSIALEDELKSGTGRLALRKEMADRALKTEISKTGYEAYVLQKDEMAARLIAQGKDPEKDPLYLENERKLQEFKAGLMETERREAEIARLMQPLTGAPVAAPVPATAGQKAATVGANILEGAGTGLVDMGEFVVRQLGRLGRLMQYGSPEMEKAGVQPPGMEVAAEWANAMREVASEWGPEVTPEIRAQLEKGFLTGTAPKALGSAISFMLPTGLLGGAAKALNLSTKAMGGLAAAGVATAGAAGSGNAFRREAEAKLRPKLEKGEITRQDFERSLGMAEAFGAALGTTEAVPLGKFVQRIGGTVAGKGFLAKLFEKAARGGNGAAMKWLAGEGGEVLAETIEEGGQELVQSLSEDLYASQTFDPERKIGADTAESAAAGGLVGFLLSLATRLIGGRRLPPGAQPEEGQTPPPAAPTTPAGTPPPAEGAATPSQNFPTADQTAAEQAQAELEAELAKGQGEAGQENPRQEAENYIFSDESHKELWIKSREAELNYERITKDESTTGTPERAAARKAKNDALEALPSGRSTPRKDNPLSSVTAYSNDEATSGAVVDLSGAKFDGPINEFGSRRIKTKDGTYVYVKENQLYPEQVKALNENAGTAPAGEAAPNQNVEEAMPAISSMTDDELEALADFSDLEVERKLRAKSPSDVGFQPFVARVSTGDLGFLKKAARESPDLLAKRAREVLAARKNKNAAAPAEKPAGQAPAPGEAAPVDIGPRDETVSTGTGVPTEKEQAILTEQQRLVDEHLAQQQAAAPVAQTQPAAPAAQPTEETPNAITQGQQPANNQPEYPGTAQGTTVQENRPEVRQAEGEQAGGGNRVVGSEGEAAPAVRPEVARTPLPENLVAPDAAMNAAEKEWITAVRAYNADKISSDEFDAARKKYQSAQAQYDAASNQEAIRVSEAPKRTIEQVKAERAQKGLGEPAPKQEAAAPETFEQKNDRLMREQNERIEKEMLSRPVLEQDPDFWVRKEVERLALEKGLSLQESREMHRDNLRKMILNGINRQVSKKLPIHANAVSERFLKKVPSGYVLKGDTYVYSKPAKQAPATPDSPAATPAVESALGNQPVKLELRRSKTGEMVEVEMSAKRAEARVQKHIDTLTQVRNCLEGIAA